MVSKSGARDIILSQIKQDFVTPANAIFDYLDIVEKALSKLDVPSDDCLLYTSPSPRDQRGSGMPASG